MVIVLLDSYLRNDAMLIEIVETQALRLNRCLVRDTVYSVIQARCKTYYHLLSQVKPTKMIDLLLLDPSSI